MSTLVAQTISNGTVSTSSANVIQGSAKAWVSFNGDTSPCTIRGSFNVGSVTKVATGRYTINFTTAMPNADYAVTGISRRGSSPDAQFVTSIDGQSAVPSTSSYSLCSGFGSNGAYVDSAYVHSATFSS
jgi:hypothetical protein